MPGALYLSNGRKVKVPQHAARLLRSATESVAQILARRESLDKAGMADKTLVVLAGEDHEILSHQVHHIAVLERLQDHFPDLAVAYEYPRDHMSLFFSKTGAIATALQRQPFDSPIILKGKIAHDIDEDACHASLRFLNFLLSKKIPTLFTDTSMKQNNSVDPHDHVTARSMRACVGLLKTHFSDISSVSAEGMHIRNHHMVERSMEYIKANAPRIFYHQCGNDHVAGTDKFAFEHSLAGYFKSKNVPYFALPVDYEDDPANTAGMTPEEFWLVQDLPRMLTGLYTTRVAPMSFGNQLLYVNALFERMGLRGHMLTPEEFADLKVQYQRDVEEIGRPQVAEALSR